VPLFLPSVVHGSGLKARSPTTTTTTTTTTTRQRPKRLLTRLPCPMFSLGLVRGLARTMYPALRQGVCRLRKRTARLRLEKTHRPCQLEEDHNKKNHPHSPRPMSFWPGWHERGNVILMPEGPSRKDRSRTLTLVTWRHRHHRHTMLHRLRAPTLRRQGPEMMAFLRQPSPKVRKRATYQPILVRAVGRRLQILT
jgi:anaerobic selenocysteine-containing dehydrogenase